MNPIPNPSRQKNGRQNILSLSFLAAHLFAGLLVPSASAQSPANQQRLTDLQASYEKAVAEKATAPYLAAVAELNQKYSAAIDRLTTAATQAGDLDTALALREEKSRLLPEGTLPEDAETLPAALKAARATYRQQVATLQAARDTAAQPLKNHFRTLLEGLLTQTTQAGRLDEALAIREKIASLSSGTIAPTAEAPTLKPTAPSSSSKLNVAKSTGKTDPEAARQIIAWALAHDSTVTTNLGIIGPKEKITTTPPGKFSVTEFTMRQSTDFPWTALEGLGELKKLILSDDASLTGEQTRHLLNLGQLTFLKIGDFNEDALTAMPFFPALFDLDVKFKENLLPTLHLLQERTASIHRLYLSNLLPENTDAFFMKLHGWPELARLDAAVTITGPIATHLIAHPKFNKLLLFSNSTIEDGALRQMKQLTELYFNGRQSVSTVQEVVSLTKLKKLGIDLDGVSITNLPDFNKCQSLNELGLEHAPSPAAEVVAKCSGIPGLKIYKLPYSQIGPPTIEALLKFKQLEAISLNECKFSPEAFPALQQLKAIKTLKELNIKNSGIPAADLKALQKALGKVVIRDK